MRSLTGTGISARLTEMLDFPMDLDAVFLYSDLTTQDQVQFAKAFQVCLQLIGQDDCWCMQKRSHAVFEGFTTAHTSRLLYKGVDARPLILAMSNRFQTDENPIIVRRSICNSYYCLNPSHYYYGTRSLVSLENAQRNKTGLSPQLIQLLRQGKNEGRKILDLSRKYSVPYHTARRVCLEETYENLASVQNLDMLEEIWSETISLCKTLVTTHPREAKQFNLAYHMANEMECLWHQKGSSKHKGNFGLMGECLDCMEEIKNGRCAVDVTQFDHKWYWTVKRFWEQVEIKGEDECWPWIGTTRRDNSESIAYFPSPFHSGKTQSAPRVAFWLSRGYTGKYRVFNRSTCDAFCCNPKHLSIREIRDLPEPEKIGEIKLRHINIFQHHRENQLQNQSSPADELPLN